MVAKLQTTISKRQKEEKDRGKKWKISAIEADKGKSGVEHGRETGALVARNVHWCIVDVGHCWLCVSHKDSIK